MPSALLLKRAFLTIRVFFNPEPFSDPHQLLRDEFSLRLRAVTFPVQGGVEPPNMEALHLCPQATRFRCCRITLGQTKWRRLTASRLRPQNADASAKIRQPSEEPMSGKL